MFHHSIPTDTSTHISFYNGVSNLILSDVLSLSFSCFLCQSADLFFPSTSSTVTNSGTKRSSRPTKTVSSDAGSRQSTRIRAKNATVDALIGSLSYSIVKTVEIKGKRFVVLRDLWGEAGWGGPWSDGSKKWTKEWLEILSELAHQDLTDLGCLMSSQFSKQALDDEIDRYYTRVL